MRLVSEPDPRNIGKRVYEIGWGRSIPCAQKAGVHASDWFMIACLRVFIGNTNHKPLVQFKETKNKRDLQAREFVGALISSYWAH